MNVFVLCTGRCGSTTFIEACRHMTNYTAAHESRRPAASGGVRGGYSELLYPKRHVEADNRLSWFLGTLDETYGRDAFYVHLLRDREEVARSFLSRWENRSANIIFPFAWGILTHPRSRVEALSERQRLEIGRQYWDTVNANIRQFLRDKALKMTMRLEEIKSPFEQFWHRIGAEGDLAAALDVWNTRHNATPAGASEELTVGAPRGNGPMRRATRGVNRDGCVTAAERESLCTAREQVEAGDSARAEARGSLVASDRAGSPDEGQPAPPVAVAAARRAVGYAMAHFRSFDLDVVTPRPKAGAWSIDAESLGFLVALLERVQPEHVLEFGSGLSTRVLAWAQRRSDTGFGITSVDHDESFLEQTRRRLDAQDPGAPVKFVWAPLATECFAGRVMPVYKGALEPPPMAGSADVILIDGPPSSLGGRTGVLYQAMDVARPGTIVLLHDADRLAERESLADWQRSFGSAIEVTRLSGFSKGLAAIIIVEPVVSKDLPAYGARAVIQELRRLIEPDATWIVVDEASLPPEALAGRRCVPFLERDGKYWGLPASGEQAVEELERMRGNGASHVAFVPDCFWWLEHYRELRVHLESGFECVSHNEHLIAYDLRKGEAHT